MATEFVSTKWLVSSLVLSLLGFGLISAPVASASSTKVDFLIQTEGSSEFVRAQQPSGHKGIGLGVSLNFANVMSGVFKRSGSSGGASGVFRLQLDFGFEIGVFGANEFDSYGSYGVSNRVVRAPAIAWLQINKYVFVGAGGYLTQFQPNVPAQYNNRYFGALGAFRLNFIPTGPLGLALDARYLHGLSNISNVTGQTVYLDGIEGVVALRIGQI